VRVPNATRTSRSSAANSARAASALGTSIVLRAGANDAVLFGNASRQTVSLPTYVANLKAILALVPASTPKFVLTPPMIQPTRWKEDRGHDKEDRSEEQTGRYAQAVRELCDEVEGAVLVDVWKVGPRVSLSIASPALFAVARALPFSSLTRLATTRTGDGGLSVV
jgi:hypothetical protein